jgi:V8-like Glu-specific endopeptidase
VKRKSCHDCCNFFYDLLVRLYSFAGDLDACFSEDGACVPYHVSCTDGVIQSDNSFVNSQCFTFHGQSGSPVWLYYPSGNKYVIRGVLASFPNSSPGTGGDGTFTLINSVVFKELQDWMT